MLAFLSPSFTLTLPRLPSQFPTTTISIISKKAASATKEEVLHSCLEIKLYLVAIKPAYGNQWQVAAAAVSRV